MCGPGFSYFLKDCPYSRQRLLACFLDALKLGENVVKVQIQRPKRFHLPIKLTVDGTGSALILGGSPGTQNHRKASEFQK